MGFRNSSLSGLKLALAALAALAFPAFSGLAASEDAGTSATLDNFILPEYHKTGNRLECILYGDKAVNQGAFITLRNTLLDIVQDNIKNINEVSNLQGVKLYPLDIASAPLKAFWKDKTHSRALVSSPQAVYDRTTKMLRGDDLVHFRSPGMDIDGVGFDANDETKFIHIRSKVKVIIRPEMRREVDPKSSQRPSKTEETKIEKDTVVK